MFVTRKLGKLLRGKITPFHLYSATLLGALIGFLPGFREAPGLYVAYLSLLVILNANLFLAGLTILLASLLALVLLPVSFYFGRLLLDGPLSGLFQTLINAPVFAWFGFENYVATGGIVLGLLFGGLAGYGMTYFVRRLRRALAEWESHPDSYEKWTATWYVKAPAWVLLGGLKGKASYAELAEMRQGKHFRTLGLALVAVLLLFLGVLRLFFQDYILTAQVRSGLERMNGATVDIASTELDLAGGSFLINGLQMADPDALHLNAFAAENVTLAISTANLLRRKFEIDSVIIDEGRMGMERRPHGVRVGPAPRPTKPAPEDSDLKGIEDYIEAAREWKERLATARKWIERISTPPPDDDIDPDGERVPLSERLRQRAEALGYAAVRADHLVAGAPRVTIRHLRAGGVRVAQLPGRLLDIEGRNLSTQPGLLDEAPEISVRSRDEELQFLLAIGMSARERTGNQIELLLRSLEWDQIRSRFRGADQLPLQGGRFDLELIGSFEPANLQLPLNARFHDTTVVIPGASPASVAQLTIPIRLTGPMDNPRIHVPADALQRALAEAGQQRLLQEGRRFLEGREDDASDAVRDRAGGVLDRIRSRDR